MVTHGSLLLLSVKEVIAQVVIRRGRGGKLTSKTKWPAERERELVGFLYIRSATFMGISSMVVL